MESEIQERTKTQKVMLFIADIIKYIHYILVFYVLTGFIYTPIYLLKFYCLMIIFVFLDWNDYDGQCVLTSYEHYFRYNQWDFRSASDSDDAPEFFRPLVNGLFGTNIDKPTARRINYFSFAFCLLLGFLRLTHHHKI